MGVDAFADNHTTTITLQDLGVLQLAAHDLFDVRRGDNMTPESAVDFENGILDLSTLVINMTSGNYFDDATIAKGGEVRNRENVVMFTVSAAFGNNYTNFRNLGDSPENATNKTLAIYHDMFAETYKRVFGEQIPEKLRGQATPDGNIALRTIHDFLPGNITVNGEPTALLGIAPNVTLSDLDMMQQSSPLDGKFDDEFLAIEINHPDGPMITVNLLEADQTFGDQFSTEFSFDELLDELEDGEYNATDKAMQGIRNLISTAYPESYQDEAAPRVVSIETGELDTIIMTMSGDIRNNRGTAGFAISGIESDPSISSITLPGNTITLTLSAGMLDSDSPRLVYDSETGGITDRSGQSLASFDRAVRNTLDTTAPAVRSVTIDNSGTVYVRLSELVQPGSAGPGDFAVNNTPIRVLAVAVSGSTVTLKLDSGIPDDVALTLNYTGGEGKIADNAGNLLGSFDEPINKQSRKRVTVKSTPAVDLASMKSLGYLDSFNGTATPHDPFAPITPMNAGDTSGFAIAINDMRYLLGGSLNTLEPQTLLTGVNNTISFAVHDRADIAHFTLYMNLHGQDTDYKDSDTYVTYDMGNIRIVDPHDLISNATVSIKTSGADSLRHVVVFVITFEGEMEQTNLVARTWNTDASSTIVRILNAFAVYAVLPDAQPALSVDPMPEDPMPDVMGEPEDAEPAAATPDQNTVEMVIRTWSGFEPGSVTDAQLLDALGLEYDGDIPSWVMTELGVLCSQDRVTIEEFTTAISYVLANI